MPQMPRFIAFKNLKIHRIEKKDMQDDGVTENDMRDDGVRRVGGKDDDRKQLVVSENTRDYKESVTAATKAAAESKTTQVSSAITAGLTVHHPICSGGDLGITGDMAWI